MKQSSTLTILLLFVFSLNAQIYINQNASGNNDGSSWQNAYTNPQDAFDNANANDEIWITSGTYKPQINVLPDSNWYFINKPLSIYGGFMGTETSLDQRDWESNPTIWDADILGDDIEDDFTNNRADNAYHLLIAEVTNGALTLDGLVITSGNALATDLTPDVTDGRPYRGAIDLRGSGIIRNCTFQKSQANAGGGLYVVPDTIGTETTLTVDNCDFFNHSGLYGSAIIIQGLDFVEFKDCDIVDNQGFRGAVYLYGIAEVKINDCNFEDNQAEDFGGGLILGNSEAVVTDCSFSNNEMPLTAIGIGIFIFQNSGNLNPNPLVEIKRCEFSENIGGAGGGICFNNFYPASQLSVDSCNFIDNQCDFASNNGGAAITIQNFPDNFGGGIPSISTNVSNSVFEGNEGYLGGAIIIYNAESTADLQISNSEFIGNSSLNVGGAIYLWGDGNIINSSINNSKFMNNEAPNGSVISTTSSTITKFENTLFYQNLGSESIANQGTMDLLGCTMTENTAGFVNYNDQEFSLQNTILANVEANNNGLEEDIISWGGNLSSDSSLMNIFIGFDNYADFNGVDPSLDMNFVPQNNSLCLDNGNPTNVTMTTDLAGEDRIQGSQIDIGSFESGFNVGLSPTIDKTRVTIYPNPFINEIHLSDINGIQQIRLLDISGKEVASFPPSNKIAITKELQNGIYLLELSYSDHKMMEKIKKAR